MPGLTACEMLSFAAQLSLPRNATRAERAERVASVMRELHLSEEDGRTKIGSVDDRGLSGGQRKRVSIGIELLAQPAVLLVDEPTSGLDAKMAHSVVSILRRIAQSGKTVVATVHQPSARLFRQFDALLLCDGKVVYGGAADAAAHFASLGFPTPPQPAEYLLTLLGEGGDDTEGAGATDLRASGSTARRGGRRRRRRRRPPPSRPSSPRRCAPSARCANLRSRTAGSTTWSRTPKTLKSLLMRLIVGVAVGVLFLG